MQMKKMTNYAVRTVIFLAKHKRISAIKISQELRMEESYTLKILKRLKKAGYVDSVSGGNGGYELINHPSSITLLDIINVMEPTIRINRCLEDDCYCSRFATEFCPVREVYSELQLEIHKMLSNTTIEKLLEES